MATAAAPAGQATTTPAGKTEEPGKTAAAAAAGSQPAPGADDAAKKPAEEKKAGDTKVADDKKAADDAAAAKEGTEAAGEKTGEGAPDKYELKLPEGSESWLDASDLSEFEKVARAEGWTNDQAQERLGLHADAMEARSAAFRAQTEADPIYGGDNLAETSRLAQLTLDKLRPAGTPRGDALRRVLAKTGFGNHIEVVSFLADLGRRMAEDSPVAGGGGGGGGKESVDKVSKLYDHPTSVALNNQK